MGAGAVEATRAGELLNSQYELHELVDSDDTSESYRATDRNAHSTVVVRLLRPEFALQMQAVDSLLARPKTLSGFTHPNVVGLRLDSDEIGIPFVVEEVCEGQRLSAMLPQFPDGMPLGVAMTLVLPIVEAVAAAHSRHIVHGRICPETIVLSGSQVGATPKLTLWANTSQPPHYVAPEHRTAKGPAGADLRADVWALGALLYRVLSGRDVELDPDTIEALDELAPHLPGKLVDLVHRCLQAAPQRRLPSAGIVLSRLSRLRETLVGPGQAQALVGARPANDPAVRPLPRHSEAPPRAMRSAGAGRERAPEQSVARPVQKAPLEQSFADVMPQSDKPKRRPQSDKPKRRPLVVASRPKRRPSRSPAGGTRRNVSDASFADVLPESSGEASFADVLPQSRVEQAGSANGFDVKDSEVSFDEVLPSAEPEVSFDDVLPVEDSEVSFDDVLPAADVEASFGDVMPDDHDIGTARTMLGKAPPRRHRPQPPTVPGGVERLGFTEALARTERPPRPASEPEVVFEETPAVASMEGAGAPHPFGLASVAPESGDDAPELLYDEPEDDAPELLYDEPEDDAPELLYDEPEDDTPELTYDGSDDDAPELRFEGAVEDPPSPGFDQPTRRERRAPASSAPRAVAEVRTKSDLAAAFGPLEGTDHVGQAEDPRHAKARKWKGRMARAEAQERARTGRRHRPEQPFLEPTAKAEEEERKRRGAPVLATRRELRARHGHGQGAVDVQDIVALGEASGESNGRYRSLVELLLLALFALLLLFAIPYLYEKGQARALQLLGDNARHAMAALAVASTAVLVRLWGYSVKSSAPMLRLSTFAFQGVTASVAALALGSYLPDGALGPVEFGARRFLPWLLSAWLFSLTLAGLLRALQLGAGMLLQSALTVLLSLGALAGSYQVLAVTVLGMAPPGEGLAIDAAAPGEAPADPTALEEVLLEAEAAKPVELPSRGYLGTGDEDDLKEVRQIDDHRKRSKKTLDKLRTALPDMMK